MDASTAKRALFRQTVALERAWTSDQWTTYFERNANNLIPIPWEIGAELSDAERRSIARSVQSFQLGESSEGNHLRKAAQVWAEANADLSYCNAIGLFIREEQRHAFVLGQFLKLNSIELIDKNWTDSLFRNVRRLAGLELSIMVLLTAEVVAQVYYVALSASTGSQVLKIICSQIIRDEAAHVAFQCERLAIMAQKRSLPYLLFRYAFQRLFLFCSLPLVWIANRLTYQAAGYSWVKFASETWLAFNRAVPLMHPENYCWED